MVALGVPSHRTLIAAGSALAALLGVAILVLAFLRPLLRVPENTIKLIVGAMTTAFGSFWTLESLGYTWLLGDARLLLLVGVYLLDRWLLTRVMRNSDSKLLGDAL